MTRRWIVAFNRDRDFYQVPLALQERNLLAGLITDFYLPPLGSLTKIRPLNRIAHRRNSGIPFRKVRWNPAALRLQLLNLRFAKNGSKRIEIFKKLDKNLSRSAFSLAQKQNADLLLYSGYAREAFESAAQTSMRKGLFIFHPHGKSSLEILEADLE